MIFLNSASMSSMRRFSVRKRVSLPVTSSAVFFVRVSWTSISAISDLSALSFAIPFFISSIVPSSAAFRVSARSKRRVWDMKFLTLLSISPRFTDSRR